MWKNGLKFNYDNIIINAIINVYSIYLYAKSFKYSYWANS